MTLAEREHTELAKLLIELAFLVPRGTDARTHSVFLQLARYVEAIKANIPSK